MADPEVSVVDATATKEIGSVEKIEVEVAYALPHEQVILKATINEGGTVADAIKHSGILVTFPEIDLAVNKVGVFGKMTKATAVLRAGDRVEIYRPLIADPKEVRRQRAAEGKRMKKGGGDLKAGEGASAKPEKQPAIAPDEAKTVANKAPTEKSEAGPKVKSDVEKSAPAVDKSTGNQGEGSINKDDLIN